jgi:hypothetical protein
MRNTPRTTASHAKTTIRKGVMMPDCANCRPGVANANFVLAATAMRLAAIIVLTMLAALPAAAANLWVFGDSNIDTGWYRVSPYSGNPSFDYVFALSATYGIGEPTNNPGPMSVEWLSRLLNMTTTASPANQGGGNYAASGAKNVDLNTPANGNFPNPVPTVTQIVDFIDAHPGHRRLAGDVVVVDSGANDVSYATGSLSGHQRAAGGLPHRAGQPSRRRRHDPASGGRAPHHRG